MVSEAEPSHEAFERCRTMSRRIGCERSLDFTPKNTVPYRVMCSQTADGGGWGAPRAIPEAAPRLNVADCKQRSDIHLAKPSCRDRESGINSAVHLSFARFHFPDDPECFVDNALRFTALTLSR